MNFTTVRSVLVAGAMLSPITAYAADTVPAAAPPPATLAVPTPTVQPLAVPAPAVQPLAVPSPALQPPAALVAPAPTASPLAAPAPAGQPADAATAPTQPAPAQAAQPAPAPVAAATATQEVKNPYGLDALWAQGDFVSRGTLVALAIMSAASWYVLITKLWQQSRLLLQVRKANRTFWAASTPEAGTATLRAGSAPHAIATSGIEAVDHHGGSLVENIDLNTWVTQSIQRTVDQVVNTLQGGLSVLATVGSIAPFVGLFGTVWGIYHALTAIGIAGQASIDKVAGPVGEALIMTAFGLAVAVPAVLGYNWLVRRNKAAVELIRNFGSDLHSVLIGGVQLHVASKAPGKAGKPLAQAA
jgi:biopolymer transport protein ExbB